MYIDKKLDIIGEEELFMNFVISGDRDSFEKLYYRVKPWLVNLIYRQQCRADSVEDILQEIWKTVCRNKYMFNPKRGKFNSFIYSIAKNEINRWYNQSKRFKRDEPSAYGYPIQEAGSEDEKVYEGILDAEILMKAVKTLNQSYQDIIVLHYFGNVEVKEIAQILGKPEGTIKTWLFRARKKLEKQLK